jgi:hypothetical protein
MATDAGEDAGAMFICDGVKCPKRELFADDFCWIVTSPVNECGGNLDHHTFCTRCWEKAQKISENRKFATETRYIMVEDGRGAGERKAKYCRVTTKNFNDYV